MAAHNNLGKAGEEEAVQLLLEKGYTILHRNWYSGKRNWTLLQPTKNIKH